MIDGVGKSGAGRIGLNGTAQGAPSAKVGTDSTEASAPSTASNPVSRMAAEGPPVDSNRVAAIRAAIAEGRYPVDPDKIAERMIALDLPSKYEA